MSDDAGGPQPFTFDGGRVDPGEVGDYRYRISETYLGDPVRIPVTIVNGERAGPTVFLSAASHGDELNGIEVVREITDRFDPADLAGTLVCLPILNVPGFLFQERYLPIYDRDLNRSFPGDPESTSAKRMAYRIFHNFIEPCDLGVDFHTSTRGRTNTLHVRADMSDPATERLANAFGRPIIIDSDGASGMLRTEAAAAGAPTITVEMGEAHRFQRDLIDEAIVGVDNVLAEYGLTETQSVDWPGWRTVISSAEKTWLRADAGGLVEMHCTTGELIERGHQVCTISNPFKTEQVAVTAPFDGLLVGVLENPVVYPGNPLCHLVELDETTQRAYRQRHARWE